MSRAFLLGVIALASATAALAQSVPVRTSSGVPEGVCGANMSCEVASLTSTGTVQSDALSGQYAFKPTVNGAKVGIGTGQAYFDAPDANTIRTLASIQAGGFDARNGLVTDSFRGSVLIGNVVSTILLPVGSPPECAASAQSSPQMTQPGGLTVVAGSTGKPHRLCLCTHDGTTYAWHNVATGAVGTSTTCPEAA